MSRKVMKWKTLIVFDDRNEVVYRFDDDKGCSLRDWNRYLVSRFGTATGWLMSDGKWPYDAYYMNCSQIGVIK